MRMKYLAKRLFRLIPAMALLLLGCCAVTGCTGNGGEETSATGTQHVEESGEPTGSDQHTETETPTEPWTEFGAVSSRPPALISWRGRSCASSPNGKQGKGKNSRGSARGMIYDV